ncbi:MAG: OmpH family outer membrane protein [Flavobacteriales bacterium]|nr:OmpH family outer membrane protein [Flavobacteriales bacterium]
MNKSTGTLLIVWNLVLSGLLGWALLRTPSTSGGADAVTAADSTGYVMPVIKRDTAALKEARIAYINTDSLQEQFDLVKEREDYFRSEGRRMEGALADKMAKAKARYNELMAKDQTYSTQEQMQADENELKGLAEEIQNQQATSQERLDKMQMDMMKEITDELVGYLKEYNKTAGFDYVFSIQSGGQIWVGNEGLNITADVLQGLNAKHRAKKAAAKK